MPLVVRESNGRRSHLIQECWSKTGDEGRRGLRFLSWSTGARTAGQRVNTRSKSRSNSSLTFDRLLSPNSSSKLAMDRPISGTILERLSAGDPSIWQD